MRSLPHIEYGFKLNSRLVEDGHVRTMSHGALRVFLVVNQQCWRVKKPYSTFAYSQLMTLTGCSLVEVKAAVKELKQGKFIRVDDATGRYNVITPLSIPGSSPESAAA